MHKNYIKNQFAKFSVYGLLYVVTTCIVASPFLLQPNQNAELPVIRNIIIFFSGILLTKYFVYMFISPWYDVITARKKIKYRPIMESYYPLVSVMIPAWNESRGVLHTVETILQSTYENIEIVIVNDGSTDNSDRLIREFLVNYDRNNKLSNKKIKYHYKKNGGKGHALNTAIKISSGQILLSIDADCIVLPETIKNFVSHFNDPEVMAAVGNVKIGNTNTIISTLQYLEFIFSFYFKKADSIMNTIYIIGGAAGAFRREIFENLGPYSTKNITEDIELTMRIQEAGMKIVYASDAVVYTEGAVRLGDLMKQRLRWKRGRFETFIDNPSLFFSLNKKHNKILSWIILPLGYLGEMQLSLELFFLTFLYLYSYFTNDFSSFISGILVVSSMFIIQMMFDDHKTTKPSFYLLSPIGWLLFYIATFVEISALFKSLWGLFRKQELKWQRWQRQGVQG